MELLKEITEAADKENHLIKEANNIANGIKDQGSYSAAADMSGTIKKAIKNIEAVGGPLIKKTWSAYKEAKALLDNLIKPLKESESVIKKGLLTYDQKIENERREAERKALIAKQEAEKKVAEEKKKAEDEQLRKAEEAEKKGNMEEAKKIIEAPVAPVAPLEPVASPVMPEKPKASGISYRDNWKVQVFDTRALLGAIIAEIVSIESVSVNMSFLNSLARTQKNALDIPGVRAINDRVVNQRV